MQVRIVSSGLNIITSMIDSHATNGWSNCGYANGFGLTNYNSMPFFWNVSLEYRSVPPMAFT